MTTIDVTGAIVPALVIGAAAGKRLKRAAGWLWIVGWCVGLAVYMRGLRNPAGCSARAETTTAAKRQGRDGRA